MARSLIDLSAKADLQLLVDVVAAMRRAIPTMQPLLVGAMARDILLHYAHGIQLSRATSDMDFAFAVGSWQEFTEMRAALIGGGEFLPVDNNLHLLKYQGKTRVDVLAFGGVEEADHTIAWPPAGDVIMNVSGYREAFADSIVVLLPGGERVDVVSLPALAALKLFAWRDRRRITTKDAIDLWSILENFLEAGNESRLYEAIQLFEQPDYDYKRGGAWLLGQDMRTLLSGGDGTALQQALEILATEASSEDLELARDSGARDTQAVVDLLRATLAGLQGKPHP